MFLMQSNEANPNRLFLKMEKRGGSGYLFKQSLFADR